jgi:hypothetical protein
MITRARRHRFDFPIVPRAGLRLWAFDGDGARTARLFAETWRGLPLWVRRRLLKHWRAERLRGERITYPRVFLTATFPAPHSDAAVLELADTVGRWCPWDGGLYLLAAIVDRMPEELVRALIAHELAHAYCTAERVLSGRYTHAREIEEDNGEEDAVREFNTWVLGHHEGPLSDWLWKNAPDVRAAHERFVDGAGLDVDEAAIDEAVKGML